MTAFTSLERLTGRAVVAVWLTDAFATATRRPPDERGPLGRVTVRITGEVVGVQFVPFPASGTDLTVRGVQHAGGFYSFMDRRLRPGTYRVEIDAEFYRRPPPVDVAVPSGDPADPTALVPAPVAGAWSPLALEPAPGYPFPPGATLLSGELRWPDGSGIEGATVTAPGTSLNTAAVGADGRWVLYFAYSHASTSTSLAIAYPPPSRLPPSYQAMLALLPATIAGVQIVQGRAGAFASTKLRGRVLTSAGLPVRGAEVEVVGLPVEAWSDRDGGYSFSLPPDQMDGAVTVEVRHPSGQQLVHQNVQVRNGRTTWAPDSEFAS